MTRWMSLVVVLLVVPLAALASNTRVAVLGDQSDIVQDETNTDVYPSNILFWQDKVTADIGESSDPQNRLWASWGTSNLGTWGFSFVGEQNNSTPFNGGGNTVGLAWGYNVTPTQGFGASVNISNEKQSEEAVISGAGPTISTTDEQKYSAYDVRAGFHSPAGPFHRVDAALGYFSGNEDMTEESGVTYGVPATGDENASMFSMDARGEAPMGGTVTFVPSFHFGTGDLDASTQLDRGTGYVDDMTSSGNVRHINAQIGARANVTQRATVFGACGWRSTRTDGKQKEDLNDDGDFSDASETADMDDTATDFPYFALGVEGKVWNWCTFRLGATKRQMTQNDDESLSGAGTTASTKTETTTSSLDMNYGFGLQFGNFWLDAAFNNDFFYNWGYIGSGATQSPVTLITLGYNWK